MSAANIPDARVLVLNRGYQPVDICGVERAMGLLWTGAAQALDEQFQTFDFDSWAELSSAQGDDVIHTVDKALKIPKILVLQVYDKLPRRKIRFSRQNIYVRDGFTCQYCGQRFPRSKLNLDHVVPRCQGGKTRWENVVTSCVKDNLRKGGRTPQEAHMQLIKKPGRPKWHTGMVRCGRRPPQEWLPFLDPIDAAYWNTELEAD